MQKNNRNKTMNKYLYTLIILALFVIGCKDNSNIVSPVDNTVNANDVVSNPNWITLPPSTET